MPVKAGDLEVVASLRDDVSGKLDKMEGKAATTGKGMEKSLGGIQNAVNAINLDRAAESVRQFGARASEVEKVRTAFVELTAAAGVSGDAVIAKTKDATKGLITEFDIMAASNKALLLGLEVSEDSMAEMATAATALGQAMKQDAGKSLDDLITALGRGSPLILDNLGLTVQVGKANETYAAELGKAASKLTEAEKKQAFFNAAMGAAREKTAELGGITVTTNDKLAIQKNRLQDVADGYAAALGPLAAVGAEFLNIGSQVALIGGIFPGTTTKIGEMGARIGLKLLPVLAGPGGLVILLGLAAGAIIAARDNLDLFKVSVEDFGKMTEQKMMETIGKFDERIRGLTEDMSLYGDVLGETSTEIAELEEKKRALIDTLNDSRIATYDEAEAARIAAEAAEAAAAAARKLKEDEKQLIVELDKVNRKWQVQAKEVQGVMSSHYELGNVIRDIEDVLDDSEVRAPEVPRHYQARSRGGREGEGQPRRGGAQPRYDGGGRHHRRESSTRWQVWGLGGRSPSGDHIAVWGWSCRGRTTSAAGRKRKRRRSASGCGRRSGRSGSRMQRTCGRRKSGSRLKPWRRKARNASRKSRRCGTPPWRPWRRRETPGSRSWRNRSASRSLTGRKSSAPCGKNCRA